MFSSYSTPEKSTLTQSILPQIGELQTRSHSIGHFNMSKAELISSIAKFLEQQITSGDVANDDKESLELAIDSIREIFHVSPDAASRDLLAVYEKGISATASSTEQPAKAAASALKEVSEEDRAEADQLKAKGNKLMGQKDYKGAADAYTEAIAKNPANPLFYSNRAAAFAHLALHGRAVEDAKKATELDPNYSKAWSRLGLALWAQGDIKGSLDAYESGLKAEGDNPTEAMKRDYENVLKRYKEEVAKGDALEKKAPAEESSGAGADAGAGGAGGGGMNFDFGQLAGLMNNPQVMNMAKQFMSNPSSLSNLMNSPMAKQMKEKMAQGGGMPDLSQLSKMMEGQNMDDLMKGFK